jgi:hypothetical protein
MTRDEDTPEAAIQAARASIRGDARRGQHVRRGAGSIVPE